MEDKLERYTEIYRRGLQDKLPPEKKARADELVRRGIIRVEQPTQQLPQQPQDMSLSGLHKAETSQGEAFGKQALESSTLGFAKKIVPGVSAVTAKVFGGEFTKDIPISELYKEAKDIYKQEQQVAKEEYPVTSFAGSVAGGIASPINPVSLKVAKAVGGGLKGALAVAGGEGALMGLGYTEDLTDLTQVAKDIGTGAITGSLFGGTLYGVGRGLMTAGKPIVSLVTPAKRKAVQKIKLDLSKEGVNPKDALQKMDDEGLNLVDVVDPRSNFVSSLSKKSYEKATIDQVDNYVNTLNRGANKTKDMVLDMVSKNRIDMDEGAELLGKNAQEVIDRQVKIRTDKAKPLYDKAFARKKPLVRKDDELLKRPVVQEAISKVRAESEKFGNTAIGNIKDLPDNSLPVLHQAKGYLYRKSKDFADIENVRYKEVYNDLSKKLLKSQPYRKATKVWAGETEGLEQLYKQKGIGNIAKKYMNNDLDGIKSSMKNVFNKSTSNEELLRIKNSMSPENFNSLVRRDLETLIDDSVGEGKNLTKALFGVEDVGLKTKRLNLLFNAEQKKGLRKLTESLDLAKTRTEEASKLKFGENGFGSIPITPYGVLNKLSDTITNLLETPKYRKEYINFLTSPEGKKILSDLSKADKKQLSTILLQINRLINQQIQQIDEGENDTSI
jgi:hypothetical protein